jgi:hypothetical protein
MPLFLRGVILIRGMKMLIKYTPKTDHIKCVPLITTDSSVKLTRSQVDLSPGINEVSEDEWKVMQTILADDNEITIVETKAKSATEKPKHARALKDIASTQAVEAVKNCSSVETLKKWYRFETREIVLLAIIRQFKKLNVDPFESTEDDASAADDDGENSGKENTGDDEVDKTLDKMTKEELLAYAAEKGIAVDGKKEEILASIKAAVENKGLA